MMSRIKEIKYFTLVMLLFTFVAAGSLSSCRDQKKKETTEQEGEHPEGEEHPTEEGSAAKEEHPEGEEHPAKDGEEHPEKDGEEHPEGEEHPAKDGEEQSKDSVSG